MLMCQGISPARPAGLRLLVVGDSLSRGLYASSGAASYSHLLADTLNMEVEILPSCTLAGAEIKWANWEGNVADVIVVELGINDVTGNPGCPQIPREEWATRYGAFLDTLLAATDATIVVGTIPWCGWEENERLEKARLYNSYIKAEAQRRGVMVADLWAATLYCGRCLSQPGEMSPFPPGFQGDGFHPGDSGHRIIAGTFLGAIKPHALYLPLVSK